MRRILAALLLVGCLLFALIPAAAAKERSFRDLDDIQNRSQVMFLVDLGMISGYADNTFRPKATISRAETAKLISLLYTDTIAAAEEETPAPFTDIAGHWAEAAIRFCAQEGILAGNGDGTFRPGDPVTARELAKMLLITVGGDASRYVGENWDDAVDDDAAAQGIYTRFTKDPSLPVNRDDACLLIYNAMQGLAIEGYDEDGNVEYVMDALRNPISFLEARFGLTRYTGVVTGNECADLTVPGGRLDEGVTKLEGHTAFQVSTDLNLVGQCVDVYVKDGQVVGTPCVSSSAVSYPFGSYQELENLLNLTDYSLAKDAAVYVNYIPAEAADLKTLPSSSVITVLDKDGDQKFEQVLAVTYQTCTVATSHPLTIQVSGSTVDAQSIQRGDAFVTGQNASCVQVADRWYVK